MSARSWLQKARPQKLPFRRRVSRAAVALIYRGEPGRDDALFFIQRAHRPGDPWSGDMAFPGGRLQPGDHSSRDTAMRETREETGLDLYRHGHYQARLSDLLTRHHSRWRPMVVTPHVFAWQGDDVLTLNHEARHGVWIPLDYLADPVNRATLQMKTPIGRLTLPCCRYQGYCIWGLSYSMMREFLHARAEAGKQA
ncbi:MutT/nudix family protein [Alcanivorax hongdengensis A-11-3]|uniref:MutT/nudix family protein n=1 Tax=Alcanivorax hongdengensis A-11-3 TaxID=1177179 RepID=L0W8D7_9GAMM|nr:CoA pyrophosphatase [Alcanivorax hongdengensis]EKF72973.1 MutT/nudix family protein [Alcanivorax hongdengensis A-11-3]